MLLTPAPARMMRFSDLPASIAGLVHLRAAHDQHVHAVEERGGQRFGRRGRGRR